jgi:hypothetical protein
MNLVKKVLADEPLWYPLADDGTVDDRCFKVEVAVCETGPTFVELAVRWVGDSNFAVEVKTRGLLDREELAATYHFCVIDGKMYPYHAPTKNGGPT